MDLNFKDNKGFQKLIKDKQAQILDKANDGIQESDGFKIIFANLKTMLADNAFASSKVIRISEASLLQTTLESIGRTPNELFADHQFKTNQIIDIDNTLNIISAERQRLPDDSNAARHQFAEMSRQGNVVFFLIENKINYFIQGSDKSESLFFSLEDVRRYNEKKEINRIDEVFSSYQQNLLERDTYCKFFIELSHLKSLRNDLGSTLEEKKFVGANKHLLRNRPEDTFRNDLKKFLELNLKIASVKEFLLENLQRLDIYLYDEYGEIYLIEVKWVGQSIHQTGKKLGTSFSQKDIDPNAFIQTLDYLKLLHVNGRNIVKAYLVVFDARKENLPDTGKDFDSSILTSEQEPHFRKFEKAADFRVVNIHPS